MKQIACWYEGVRSDGFLRGVNDAETFKLRFDVKAVHSEREWHLKELGDGQKSF